MHTLEERSRCALGARAIAGVLVLTALTLAGCGGSGVTTVPHIEFKSTAVKESKIAALYTCDGRNIPPPVEWGSVPAGVKALALFVVGYTPDPTTHNTKVSVDWAVAGLNPALHSLAGGKKLPSGAFMGLDTNGKQGYSICPKRGVHTQYQFELYGLPASVEVQPGFPGLEVISALSAPSRSSGERAYGAFVANYKR